MGARIICVVTVRISGRSCTGASVRMCMMIAHPSTIHTIRLKKPETRSDHTKVVRSSSLSCCWSSVSVIMESRLY
jgi:hypothetical protein